MFVTADGESGKAGGNETIRVDAAGRLHIKVPAALANQFGSHLVIAAPVGFSHRGAEWAARVAARAAVRYDIAYEPARGRWYLDASWTLSPTPAPELDDLRRGPVLGVDLNADHLAACVLDVSGNPMGAPLSIAVKTAGLKHRGVMGGSGQRSAACSLTSSSTTARRSWWKTSTSPTREPPAGKPWAAVSVGNGCAAPSPTSPPDGSVPG